MLRTDRGVKEAKGGCCLKHLSRCRGTVLNQTALEIHVDTRKTVPVS